MTVIIYEGKTVREFNLPNREAVTDASTKLTFTNTGSDITVSGRDFAKRTLSDGEIVRVSETLALSVYEQHNALNQAILLSGQSVITIGRSSSSDIRFNTRQTSGNHAILRNSGGRNWSITDNGSTNGTYINGKLVKSAALNDGDVVFIGGWNLVYDNAVLSVTNCPGEFAVSSKLTLPASRPMRAADLPDAPYPYFQKSPRLKPETVKAEIEVLSPPSAGSKPSVSWLSVLLPPFAMIAIMALVAAISGNTMSLLYTAPMSLIGVVVGVVNYNAQMKKWRETTRLASEKYTEHIKVREEEIATAETTYLSALNMNNPGIADCVVIASKRLPRLWERSVYDDDFLAVRVGAGKSESNVTIKLPQEQLTLEENPLLKQAREMQSKHAYLSHVPVVNDFAGALISGVSGSRAEIIKMLRAILVSIATHHSYEDVRIVCVFPNSEKEHWKWVRFLPHIWNDDRTKRFLASSPEEAKTLLTSLEETVKSRRKKQGDKTPTPTPWYFVVLADKTLVENSGFSIPTDSGDLGISLVYAYGETSKLPDSCRSIIECGSRECSLVQKSNASKRIIFQAEDVSAAQADTFARSIAPVRFHTTKAAKAMPTYVTFMQGLNAGKVEELDVLGRWNRSRPFDSLAAPIGIRENGEVFNFDISDKAMGAHGLVGAMAGWGKTKMLNTYILSVALNFSPIEVNFVLVDFKGTDLGRGLTNLPHIAGQISNIEDIGMIDRNLRSLKGELIRRQKLFAATGIENIHKYQEAFRSNRVNEPLPYILFIVDEFAEMKKSFPEKMDDIIQIARIGRSLGVYMTLATQAPDSSNISGQVEANTHFRICLKTAGPEQSKAMLGTNDAFGITTKGRAIIKVGDNEVYEQVQTFYIDADYVPEKGNTTAGASKIYIVEANGERVKPEVYDKSVGVLSSAFTEGVAVANYIKNMAERSLIPKAKKVWTEALPESLNLETLIAGREAFVDGVWTERNGGFNLVAGLVDDPDNQTQYPLVIDFAANGHTAVYGAPSSGKTTFLQTVMMSVAYTYTPAQTEFVIFDFGNYALQTFEKLPHTRYAVNSGDNDRVKEAEDYILTEIERRKRLFASQGAGTIETYRAVSGESLSYMLIVADNMASLANQFSDLAESLSMIARDGGNLGLYLLVTAGNQGSAMYRIAQYIKTSIALQLTDKSDYRQLIGGNSKQEPGHFPGRGFIKGALEFQTALFADGSEAERITHLRKVCEKMSGAWNANEFANLKQNAKTQSSHSQAPLVSNFDMVQIGVNRTDFTPFEFNFREMSGYVISGVPQSGKTNLLRHIAAALSNSADTQVYIFEKGSALSILCQNAKYALDGASFDSFAVEIAEEYDKRTESEANTPRIVIIIDDFGDFFDEIADATVDLLDPLINYGEEYGIYTYIAGGRSELEKLRFGASPLSNALSFGRGFALGGKLKEHSVFDGLYKSEDMPLAPFEAAVVRGGKAVKVKIAEYEVTENA